jgi:aryl-alcohol dehydrogenase-like predicted oxidoreductase
MKLALGTAQFGLQYGINNNVGVPDDLELSVILNLACKSGIRLLDTAEAYGNAENRIAKLSKKNFDVITKFSKVSTPDLFRNKLDESLFRLNTDLLYGYIAHNANELIKFPGIWQELLKAKNELGKVKKIGYSLYNVEQLEKLLDLGCIPDLVQMPYSLLDRKFENHLSLLKKMEVEIHTRSAFLQGLYFMDTRLLPSSLKSLESTLLYLHDLCLKYEISIGSLALNYTCGNKNIDAVVIGVETCTQLQQNIDLINVDLDSKLIDLVNEIKVSNIELLNPGNWKN